MVTVAGDNGSGSSVEATMLNIPYGEIYSSTSSGTIAVPANSVPLKIETLDTAGLSNKCTIDTANNQIKFQETGKYKVSATLIASPGNNFNLFAHIYLGGVRQDNFYAKEYIASTALTISFSGIINVSDISDSLDIRVYQEDVSDKNVVILSCNLNVQYLGE